MWKCWIDCLILEEGTGLEIDIWVLSASECSWIHSCGYVHHEGILNNFIIHSTDICRVPPCTQHCADYSLWVSSYLKRHCFRWASRPRMSLTLTLTNEWIFTNRGKCSDRKEERLWQHRTQKSSVQASRKDFAIQGLFVDTVQSCRSRPASLHESLLDPPTLCSFPSWAPSSEGFFYFQLCIFFYRPPTPHAKMLPALSSLPSIRPSIRTLLKFWPHHVTVSDQVEATENHPGTVLVVTHFQNMFPPATPWYLLISFFLFILSFILCNVIASRCCLWVVKSYVNKPWPLCLGPNRN